MELKNLFEPVIRTENEFIDELLSCKFMLELGFI